MIGLVWIAAFGANVAVLGEVTTFPDRAACEQFGRQMAPRAADYARGMFKLNWSINVVVEFHCAVNGQPA